MSMTKRMLARLLAVLLMVGVLPMQTHAAETGTAITATELPGLSRLEQPSDEKETEAYAPDEPVTVIVKMEEPAVLATMTWLPNPALPVRRFPIT